MSTHNSDGLQRGQRQSMQEGYQPSLVKRGYQPSQQDFGYQSSEIKVNSSSSYNPFSNQTTPIVMTQPSQPTSSQSAPQK